VVGALAVGSILVLFILKKRQRGKVIALIEEGDTKTERKEVEEARILDEELNETPHQLKKQHYESDNNKPPFELTSSGRRRRPPSVHHFAEDKSTTHIVSDKEGFKFRADKLPPVGKEKKRTRKRRGSKNYD